MPPCYFPLTSPRGPRTSDLGPPVISALSFRRPCGILPRMAIGSSAFPPAAGPARFKVVRFHLSKGDVAFEETVGEFATEADAQAFRAERLREPAATPRWPDYDDYGVFPLAP